MVLSPNVYHITTNDVIVEKSGPVSSVRPAVCLHECSLITRRTSCLSESILGIDDIAYCVHDHWIICTQNAPGYCWSQKLYQSICGAQRVGQCKPLCVSKLEPHTFPNHDAPSSFGNHLDLEAILTSLSFVFFLSAYQIRTLLASRSIIMPETQYFEHKLKLSSRSEPAGIDFPAKLAYWSLGDKSKPAVLMPTCFGGTLGTVIT